MQQRVSLVFYILTFLLVFNLLYGVYNKIGYINVPAYDLVQQGNHVYVAANEQGLVILDVSNPQTPVQVSSITVQGSVTQLTINSNKAYLTCGAQGIAIVDISNPLLPVQIGQYITANPAIYVEASNNIAYICESTSGMQIVDCSTPSQPVLLYTHHQIYNDPVNAVKIINNLAYVVGGYPDLQIMNVSNPSSPTMLGTFDQQGFGYNIEIVGSFAYLTSNYLGLKILSVSNPNSPSYVGVSYNGELLSEIKANGNRMYGADLMGNLVVFNLDNAAAPTVIGSYNTVSNAYSVLYLSNDIAYVALQGGGIQIININNPTDNTIIGSYDYSPLGHNLGYNLSIAISDTQAYVCDDYNGLIALNLSNSNSPSFQSLYQMTPDNPWGYNYAVANGSIVYAANPVRGLHVLNYSNPTSPSLVYNYDTPGTGYCVRTSNNRLYFADGGTSGSGTLVFNITNPTSPSLIGTYADTGSSIDTYSNYVYLAKGEVGFKVVNFTNSGSPILATTIDTPGSVSELAVYGSYLYVADGSGGISIYNVSSPAAPVLAATIPATHPDSNCSIEPLVIGNKLFFVDNSWNEVFCYDITNQTIPRFQWSYKQALKITHLEPYTDYIVTSNGRWGIGIYDFSSVTSNADYTNPTPQLLYVYPNPFNSVATVKYNSEIGNIGWCTVYNIRGQKVNDLFIGSIKQGLNYWQWDGNDSQNNIVTSGIYLVRIKCGRLEETRKVILIR